MASAPRLKYTIDEYLALEETAEYRSEYFAGEIFAMAGGSPNHNRISRNILAALHRQLRGSGRCEVFGADQRVAIKPTHLFTYPDVVVACGDREFEGNSLLNPKVICEVLSRSTESYDRGKKFDHYRRLDSLAEYLLVSQSEPHVERFVRQPGGAWVLTEAKGLESELEIAAIHCRLSLADVYEGVDFSQAEQPELRTRTDEDL